MVVIPDFATGAMENWGLITFRETAVLYDPIETSTSAHQWVAIVIAHELAHQVNKHLFVNLKSLSLS